MFWSVASALAAPKASEPEKAGFWKSLKAATINEFELPPRETVNFYGTASQTVVADAMHPMTVPLAPRRNAKKNGKLSKLKAWWKTSGKHDVANFALEAIRTHEEHKAAKRAAKADPVDFPDELAGGEPPYHDRDTPSGRTRSGRRWRGVQDEFPWWLLVVLGLLVVVAVVVVARKG